MAELSNLTMPLDLQAEILRAADELRQQGKVTDAERSFNLHRRKLDGYPEVFRQGLDWFNDTACVASGPRCASEIILRLTNDVVGGQERCLHTHPGATTFTMALSEKPMAGTVVFDRKLTKQFGLLNNRDSTIGQFVTRAEDGSLEPAPHLADQLDKDRIVVPNNGKLVCIDHKEAHAAPDLGPGIIRVLFRAFRYSVLRPY